MSHKENLKKLCSKQTNEKMMWNEIKKNSSQENKKRNLSKLNAFDPRINTDLIFFFIRKK